MQPKPSNSPVLGSGVVVILMGPGLVRANWTEEGKGARYAACGVTKVPGKNEGPFSLPW